MLVRPHTRKGPRVVGVAGRSARREARRRRSNFVAPAAFVGLVVLAGPSVIVSSVGHRTGLPLIAAAATATGLATLLAGRAMPAGASWKIGADGEQLLATMLARRLPPIAVVLHDRSIPGVRANIDHVVVGPAGVYVLDAKRLAARVVVRSTRGADRRRRGRLVVGGRNRADLLDGMAYQCRAVEHALAVAGFGNSIRVRPMVVLVARRRPRRGSIVDGVWVGPAPAACSQVASRGPLTPARIEQVAEVLIAALPPA